MPYIKPEKREELRDRHPRDVGELTYELTHVVMRYLRRPKHSKSPRFADVAEVLAALEAAKLEFYRRVVAPYEDQKCAENGDVYDGR